MHAGTRTTTTTGSAITVTRPPKTRSFSLAPARLAVPETVRFASAERAAALGLARGRVLTVVLGTSLVVAATGAHGSTLLPVKLRRRASARTVVRLGGDGAGIRAYRYQLADPSGQAYAVPTDRGIVTMLCLGSDAKGMGACRSIVSTLTIHGAHVFPPGDPEFAAGVRREVDRLHRQAAAANAEMAQAQTPSDQAGTLSTLANDVLASTARLTKLRASPESQAARGAIVRALAGMHRSLAALAHAAADHDAHAFAHASGELEQAQQLLSQVAAPYGVRGA
jgi:hypothetical protein